MGLRQLLFDRQFDRFHAAIDAQLVEDVRDMEFDRAQTDNKTFSNLIVVESIHHAFENITFAFCQLFTRDLRLRDGLCQNLGRFRGERHASRARGTDGIP